MNWDITITLRDGTIHLVHVGATSGLFSAIIVALDRARVKNQRDIASILTTRNCE